MTLIFSRQQCDGQGEATALGHLESATDELHHALHFADAMCLALVGTTPEMQVALNMVVAGLTGAAEYVAAAQSGLRKSA